MARFRFAQRIREPSAFPGSIVCLIMSVYDYVLYCRQTGATTSRDGGWWVQLDPPLAWSPPDTFSPRVVLNGCHPRRPTHKLVQNTPFPRNDLTQFCLTPSPPPLAALAAHVRYLVARLLISLPLIVSSPSPLLNISSFHTQHSTPSPSFPSFSNALPALLYFDHTPKWLCMLSPSPPPHGRFSPLRL